MICFTLLSSSLWAYFGNIISDGQLWSKTAAMHLVRQMGEVFSAPAAYRNTFLD